MLQVQAVFPLLFFFFFQDYWPILREDLLFFSFCCFVFFFLNISSVVVNESINSNFIALVRKTGIHYVHCTNLGPSTV